VAGVSAQLDPGSWKVVGAMRYANPSVAKALAELKDAGVERTIVLPLYPQYSLAATESSIHHVREQAMRLAPGMKLDFVPAFYADPGFLGAFTQVAREALAGFEHQHLLFSFHGLPERQIRKTDPSRTHCLQSQGCCDAMGEANRNCYRAQCYSTARELAKGLGLSSDRYTVCFQSRLGRTPWIRPYTDVVLEELAARGIKRLAVVCPAFVADCLETLEEIQIRARETFIGLGGEELRLVPSLNSSPAWVRAVADLARNQPG
jgi:ferrochelatase